MNSEKQYLGTVGLVLVRLGVARFGNSKVWHSMVWCGKLWLCTASLGMVRILQYPGSNRVLNIFTRKRDLMRTKSIEGE